MSDGLPRDATPLQPVRFWAICAEEFREDAAGSLVRCSDIVAALRAIMERAPGEAQDCGYGWLEYGENAWEQLEALVEHLS